MWRAWLALAALCAAPVLGNAPYPKECNKGPDYWCSTYRNAQECDAVGHCLQTVWEKQKYPFDSDVVAVKFTKLFDQLRQRKDSFDDEQVQSVLDSACHSIPHKAGGLKCKEYIGGLAVELKSLLSSHLSSSSICSIMGLCNNPKMDHLLGMPKHTKATEPAPKVEKKKLLGTERCTWGPSYWCDNLSNSHDCHATRHCIQHVWSKQKLPEDHDDICKICTDMVKQARDQLQSNETQEELKEVFEGSCQLIPIKLVAKECMRLADDFVPELVETLASEMNPQTVCSVAGLCNSARIDKMLAEYEAHKQTDSAGKQECAGCHSVVGLMRKKFEDSTYEQFLMNLLQGCRNLGSYSDSCSMHVFSRFEDIYSTVKEHFTSENVCLISGQCAQKFHSHGEEYTFVEISNSGSSGLLAGQKNDNLPCELCEQLVKHLRDVVVANTTELEFETVLKGICKQTGNFKVECLSLVEQWYPVFYNYLVSDLKPDEVCALAGICHVPTLNTDVPIAPLVSSEVTVKVIAPSSKLIGTDEANSYKTLGRVGVLTPQSSVRVLGPELYALPLERMFPSLPQGKGTCAFCQYLLHYVQVEISDSNNEAVIKSAVEHACERLPTTVSDECKQFVEAYGPSVIALLVQEIDPASVCPELGCCNKTEEVRKVTINEDSSNCPLCLFAVEQLETVLKNNRTEASIRVALDNLCSHLSQKMKSQCIDFVDKYANQLVEMLVAEMNAQEVCVYLKLCTDSAPDAMGLRHTTESAIDKFHSKPHLRGDRRRMRKPDTTPKSAGVIETNEIRDLTYNGRPTALKQKSFCVICEFVMKEIDSEIKDKRNEDELKKIVHSICSKMPKSVRSECNQFVDKYADLVISLLAQELDADEICQELKLCDPSARLQQVKEGILDCAVCETVIMAVQKVMGNPDVDHRVVHVMEKACNMLPAKYYDRCTTLMEIYGDSVIHLIEEYGTKGVCQKIGLCGGYEGTYVHMFKEGRRH